MRLELETEGLGMLHHQEIVIKGLSWHFEDFGSFSERISHDLIGLLVERATMERSPLIDKFNDFLDSSFGVLGSGSFGGWSLLSGSGHAGGFSEKFFFLDVEIAVSRAVVVADAGLG